MRFKLLRPALAALFLHCCVWVRAADTTPPTIISTTPLPGSTVNNLTQINVVFSEPVVGVEAWNIQVNATDAADVSGIGFTNFTFTFTQPLPGAVSIAWDTVQAITDQAGNPFAGGSAWQYTLLDTLGPTILTLRPAATATVGKLTEVAVTFSEVAVGVDAADLLVNGQPATSVSGTAQGPYLFQFSQPTQGVVNFTWSPTHGITDLLSNAFGGSGWSVTLSAAALTPTVRINEFLASNASTNGLRDEDKELNAWIELFNYGSSSVNLTGYALTDSAGDPGQWIFPATNLAAGQYLLVFASGKDRRAGATNLHTNFKLNPDGDYLALFNAESPPTALSEFAPQFPSQRNDYSYGLNSSNEWRYYRPATPRATNGNSAISGTLPPVHFSIERGFFNAPFNLLLTLETPGASIRFTTDGTQPTESNGFLYTNALLMAHQTTLRAAAFMTNVLPSLVQTHTYMFLEDVIHQSAVQTGVYSNLWGTVGPDYEMDQRVVTNQAYAGTIKNDLMSIPTLSIVLAPDDMFGSANGIYTHSDNAHLGPAWTRACSVELINPDGTKGFQLDSSIKMHGGGSREQSKEKKHPMALAFKATYGASKLQYPFFPDSPVTEFDKIILRSEYNNHWTHETDNAQRARGTMARDEWFKDTLGAMGSFSSHGRYVHLYINGLYWGVYNPCEHHDASFAASYLGGDKSEYDAVAAGDLLSVLDGNLTARNTLLSLAGGNLTDPAQYELMKQNLDINQYADYMILLLYGANLDWGTVKNWTALRHRVPGGGWKYMAWDSERTFEDVNAQATSFTGLSPDNLHNRLAVNPEYRLAFGDRVQKHFFNNGALTTNAIQASWKARASLVDRAIVAESARWGDLNAKAAISPSPYPGYSSNAFYTHDEDWVGYQGVLRSNYFPIRSGLVLNQFRALGLYPSNAAPSYSQLGGRVAAGYQLYITNNAGTGAVYYTTNGTDPRIYGSGAVSAQAITYTNGAPLTIAASTQVKARALSGTNWSALVDATFLVAQLIPPLRISELMYAPSGGDSYEFVELQNSGGVPLDLGGYFFNGIVFQFPPGVILNPGERLVLASNNDTNSWKARYPGVSVEGWYSGKLSNTGEPIEIFDATGKLVVSVDYLTVGGWPLLAAGGGYSLELINPDGDPDDPANWRASAAINGTPGLASTAPPPSAILLNEVMAENVAAVNNGGTYPDWVELFNSGATSMNLSGWSLSDDGNPRKYVLPDGTVLTGGGYLVIWCDSQTNTTPGLHSGFSLNRAGESLFLYDTNGTRVDAISFGGQLADYSLGRIGAGWQLNTPTPNAVNVAAPVASVTNLVINEWLANPVFGGSDWVELFNRSSNAPIALRNLYLGTTNALFQIKSHSFLAPRGYLQLLADALAGPAHLDFKLPATGGFVVLYDETGSQVDRISYGAQTTATSQGRLPDGSSTIVNFPGSVSPGAANYVANYTGPLLNEVMADNNRAVTNADGTVSDWVELYNPGTNGWNWDGWSLSVDAAKPGQWLFPTGLTLGAQSYLVIGCDGNRPASPLNQTVNLNTGHSISKQSGGVYLFNPAGQLMDSIEFGFQVADKSLGKSGGLWQLLATPTPGASNSAPATLGSIANLRFNEWMAAPASGDDWFELYNADSNPVSLSGLYLSDDPSLAGQTNTVVAPLSFIAGHGFVVWIADGLPSNGRDHAGFSLDALGETLRLYSSNLIPIDAIDFGLQADNVSQGRLPDGAASIVRFPATSTPGESNYLPPVSALINETLTHTDPPLEDAIELYNPTGAALSLGGWFLSNSADDFKKYRIPNGTLLPAGSFLVFYENQFNGPGAATPFTLNSAHGDQIWLSAADGLGNLTGVRATVSFGAGENGVSFGRFQTSIGAEFTALSGRSFGVDSPASVEQFRTGTGAGNAAPKIGPVVITELMYHPPDIGGTNDDTLNEYIELYNSSGSPVLMYDPAFPTNQWRLQDGVSFTFTNISIPAGAYVLVVSFDPVANPAQLAAFQGRYGLSAAVPVYGPYIGKLSNSGEAVELVKPDAPQAAPHPDAGFVPYIRVDRVVYGTGLPWPSGADGSPGGIGLSLQRRDAAAYGNEPLNWLAGSPTPGAANGAAFISLPVINQQPQTTAGLAGATASFSVSAAGAALKYQWRLNGVSISGATNALLALGNIQSANEGSYTVFVSNPAGSVLSSGATLTVTAPPTITQQPQTQVAAAGSSVTFSVLATGGGLNYQWRFNGSSLTGATNSSLTLNNVQSSQAGPYSVVITNAFGPAVSDNAYLVMASPGITQQPQSRTNYTTTTATFTVGASGDAPLSYQWRKNGGNLTGATNATLILSGLQTSDAGDYNATVSNPAGITNSATATLTVVVQVQILQQPTNQVINGVGSNVTFTVSAIGTGTLRYQWLFNGTNIVNNPTATNSSLTVTNAQLTNNGNYSVVVTDDLSSLTSTNASLLVKLRPTITQQPVSLTVAVGSTVTFNISATGTFPLGYRWRKGIGYLPDAIGYFSLNGNTSSFSITNVQASDATNYNVGITNISGGPASGLSANAYLTVVTPPADQTVLAGSNITFSASAVGSAPSFYRWQFKGTDIPGATNNTLSLAGVQSTNAGLYGVVVTVVTNVVVAPATFTANLSVQTPPLLSQPLFLNGGNFQMNLQGEANRSYFIDISSNMTNWSLLTNLVYTNGQMPFTDTTATNSQRFYRARLAP